MKLLYWKLRVDQSKYIRNTTLERSTAEDGKLNKI
jgi:hypothetical protein